MNTHPSTQGAERTEPRPGSRIWTILLAGLFALCPSPRADSILLTGATLHLGDGSQLSPGQILVKDGRIEAMDRILKAKADRVVKLDGLQLYPGLIALDSALGLVEIEAVKVTVDRSETGAFNPEIQAWSAVNPDSELIPVARANGITAIEVSPTGGTIPGRSGLLQLDGWTVEEMGLKLPAALHLQWPSTQLSLAPRTAYRDASQWKSPSDQDKSWREKVRELTQFLEEAHAYHPGDAGPTHRIPAYAALKPVWESQMPVIVHADSAQEIRSAVQWATNQNVKLVICGGRDALQVAPLLASNQVPVIYKHVFNLPSDEAAGYDAHFRAPGELHQAGVAVLLANGGRMEASFVRNLPFIAAQAVAFGWPEAEAMKSLTQRPAELLGVGDQIGRIAIGLRATFFATDGNLFDVRSHVKRMWISGKEVSLDSRHTRLEERYRARPKPADATPTPATTKPRIGRSPGTP